MKNKIIVKILSLLLCCILSVSLISCDIKALLGTGEEALTVKSVVKTATDGLTDTYTIYFSDGSTGTFTVTNGKDGENGKNGSDGKDGADGEDGESVATDGVGIAEIKKTGSSGLVDTYTIYFTDGTETTFDVTNGKDGEDITALALYESYKEKYGDNLTYSEFLSKYMTVEGGVTDDSFSVVNDCLRTSAKVYTKFTESGGEKLYAGSAFIYRIDGDYTYFITNFHVIYNPDATGEKIANTVCLYLYGSESKPTKMSDGIGNISYDWGDSGVLCDYVGGAAKYDIAVIRASTVSLKKINPDIAAVTYAEDYHVGEAAIAIGNPGDEGISVTQGIVSVDNEYVNLEVGEGVSSYRSIRIDTPLYHGNSGGALFNSEGELIGVANAGDGEDQNINYAIPIQIVKAAVHNIMTHYSDSDTSTVGVYKPTIGVTIEGKNSRYVYDSGAGYGRICEDVTVAAVTPGSIVESLGITVGDIIRRVVINGDTYTVSRSFDLGDLCLYLTEGATLSIVYEREGVLYESEGSYTVKKADLLSVD